MSARDAYLALVSLVALERAVELVVSRRHERALRARGAVERGAGHYPPMVALHAAFLAACAAGALLRPAPPRPWSLAAAGAVVVAQGLRWWAIATLGERWTTRILALPGTAPVTGGPYRYLRHPNYLAVVIEIAALPLAYGLVAVALAFSALDAVVLAFRIRAEERSLGTAWERAFRGRGRFVPWGHGG